jgi:hypothetical protein
MLCQCMTFIKESGSSFWIEEKPNNSRWNILYKEGGDLTSLASSHCLMIPSLLLCSLVGKKGWLPYNRQFNKYDLFWAVINLGKKYPLIQNNFFQKIEFFSKFIYYWVNCYKIAKCNVRSDPYSIYGILVYKYAASRVCSSECRNRDCCYVRWHHGCEGTLASLRAKVDMVSRERRALQAQKPPTTDPYCKHYRTL